MEFGKRLPTRFHARSIECSKLDSSIFFLSPELGMAVVGKHAEKHHDLDARLSRQALATRDSSGR
jgi:hypothetical protein